MVANSDKPLNAKDHVEKLAAHQHDASTLSRDIHHAPFDKQLKAQQAAFEAGEKPKTKGVELSEPQLVDEHGHIHGGKIKLPGGDSYESTDGGKTWIWHTSKDGQKRDFKITGMKEPPHIDADGKLTMRFADGRRHEISKEGKFASFDDTVRFSYADGRPAEYFNLDEVGNNIPAGAMREDRHHDLEGLILTIDARNEAGQLVKRTSFSYDQDDEVNGIREDDLLTGKVALRKKVDNNEWAYCDENGNVISTPDDNGQMNQARIPMGFHLDQQSGELKAYQTYDWDIDSASGKRKGWLSAKFEANGDPGKINMDPNRASGWDYGPWQMNAGAGTPQRFVAWAKNHAPEIYEKLGPHTGSINQGDNGSFGHAWKQIAGEDRNGFLEAQRKFMLASYLGPLLHGFGSRLQDNEILQEHAYAMSVQFGPEGASRLMKRAGALDSNVSDIEYSKRLVAEASRAYPKNASRYRREGEIVVDNLHQA